VLILVYVDDLLIAVPEAEVKHLKDQLDYHFIVNASELIPSEFKYIVFKSNMASWTTAS
jgi:hypothetical protein